MSLQKLPFIDITYCKYGYKYRKKTRIWHNNFQWQPRAPCCFTNPCDTLVGGRHPMTAQRGPAPTKGIRNTADRCSLNELYSIPPLLCDEIAAAASVVLQPHTVCLPTPENLNFGHLARNSGCSKI